MENHVCRTDNSDVPFNELCLRPWEPSDKTAALLTSPTSRSPSEAPTYGCSQGQLLDDASGNESLGVSDCGAPVRACCAAKQQQQQQQQMEQPQAQCPSVVPCVCCVVIDDGTRILPESTATVSYFHHQVFASVVFLCCNLLFGLFAWLLAYNADIVKLHDPAKAETLGRASMLMSLVGIFLTIVVLAYSMNFDTTIPTVCEVCRSVLFGPAGASNRYDAISSSSWML